MKNITIGLILGGCIVVGWCYMADRACIPKTVTITNQVTVTMTETQVVEETKYNYVTVYRTNEIWQTNIVEKEIQKSPVARPVALPVNSKTTIPQAPVTAQPPPAAPTVSKPSGFRGPSSAGKITESSTGKTKMGVKRNLDGSVKQ